MYRIGDRIVVTDGFRHAPESVVSSAVKRFCTEAGEGVVVRAGRRWTQVVFGKHFLCVDAVNIDFIERAGPCDESPMTRLVRLAAAVEVLGCGSEIPQETVALIVGSIRELNLVENKLAG